MDMLDDPELDGDARSAAITLISWLDDHDRVTTRIVQWLTSGDERLRYQASQLLRLTRDPAQCKERARALLAVDQSSDITEDLLAAREPKWMMGPPKAVNAHLAEEFLTWAEEKDERLAAIGLAGAKRYLAYTRTDATEDEHDGDPQWG